MGGGRPARHPHRRTVGPGAPGRSTPPSRPAAPLPHLPPPLLPLPRRGDVPLAKVADRFMARLNELEESSGATPVLLDADGRLSFVYVQYSNLYLLAVARSNINAAAVLVFLHKLIEIFKHYFHEVRRGGGGGARGERGRWAAAASPACVLTARCCPPAVAAGGGVTAGQLCDCL